MERHAAGVNEAICPGNRLGKGEQGGDRERNHHNQCTSDVNGVTRLATPGGIC